MFQIFNMKCWKLIIAVCVKLSLAKFVSNQFVLHATIMLCACPDYSVLEYVRVTHSWAIKYSWQFTKRKVTGASFCSSCRYLKLVWNLTVAPLTAPFHPEKNDKNALYASWASIFQHLWLFFYQHDYLGLKKPGSIVLWMQRDYLIEYRSTCTDWRNSNSFHTTESNIIFMNNDCLICIICI